MKICIITDNTYIFDGFTDLLKRKPQSSHSFDFYFTSWNRDFREKFAGSDAMKPIRLKEQNEEFFSKYDMFISLHCKQLFPKEMVENHLCLNVHPGYNPYNRGWFPQVFGIMNKLPIGVTIHKMDAELDHGDILWQKKIPLHGDDTSKDIYNRILETEMEMLDEHLEDILSGNYMLTPMQGEGNVNSKQDFDNLCAIDMNKQATYGEVIDYLRALTFAPYNNAYFYDDDGKKVYVGVTLKKED